jgi:hypothetical protein
MKTALPGDVVSERQFPKTYAWIARFRAAVRAAKTAVPRPTTLKGPDAAKFVLDAEFADAASGVDPEDPLGLTEGMEVELHPTDSGANNRDRGRLVALTASEVSVAVQSSEGVKEVRIHAPRTGFRVTKLEATVGIGAKM